MVQPKITIIYSHSNLCDSLSSVKHKRWIFEQYSGHTFKWNESEAGQWQWSSKM